MIAKYLATLLANGCSIQIEPVSDGQTTGAPGIHADVRITLGKMTWAIYLPPGIEFDSAAERTLGHFIRERNWPIRDRL